MVCYGIFWSGQFHQQTTTRLRIPQAKICQIPNSTSKNFPDYGIRTTLDGVISQLMKPTLTDAASNISSDGNRFVNFFKVALVTWTESVGLTLVHRDLSTMHLRTPYGEILVFSILQIFPFTSETKRMGIIVKVSNPVSVVFEVQTFSSLKDVLKCESSLIFTLSDFQMAHQKKYLMECESSVIST